MQWDDQGFEPKALLVLLTVAVSFFPPEAQAQQKSKTFHDYMYGHRYECIGPFAQLQPPVSLTVAGKQYELHGHRLVVQSGDADHHAKLGVLSAIKDSSPETLANLHGFFDWFTLQNVDAIIVNGDLAMDEFELDQVLELLGQTGALVFVSIGNSESSGSFSRATRRIRKKYPNVFNLGWVRQVIGDDFELVSLPGYHDRRFVHVGSACLYKKDHIDTMVHELEISPEPTILVTHGPPRCRGSQGLDRTSAGAHVGDPQLNDLIRRLDISFGIHGHILEAGGTAMAGDFKRSIREGRFSSSLFINAGSANGLPWLMNDDRPLRGMAAIMTIRKDKASVIFKRRR